MGSFRNQQGQNTNRRTLRNNATPAEVRLWHVLKGRYVGFKFRRQHGIGSFILDFFCPKLRFAIELDGITHTSVEEKAYDARRDTFMAGLGITTLRFSNSEVFDRLDFTVDKIQKQIHVQCEKFQIEEPKTFLQN